MKTRPCKACSAPLVKGPGPGRWPRYCGDECRYAVLKAKRRRESERPSARYCDYCGEPYKVKMRPGPTPRFCKPVCRRAADLERKKKRRVEVSTQWGY
jgi:hypothetical protein